MKIQILSENYLRHAGLGQRFNLQMLNPGDMLQARIVGRTADGHTLLQFPQFSAVSDQPLAGRVGTRIDFEVLAHPRAQDGRQLQVRLAIVNQAAQTQRIIATSIQTPRGLGADGFTSNRGAVDHGANQRTAESHQALTADSALASDGRNADRISSVISPAADTIRRWLQRLPLQFHREGAAEQSDNISEAHKHNRDGRLTLGNEKTSPTGPERSIAPSSGEMRPAFWFQGMDGMHRPIQMHVQQHTSGGRAGSDGAKVSATLMLEFESLGPVHIDLRMSGARIWLDFGVASAAAHQIVLSHLNEIDRPLRALAAGGVCCRVRVQDDDPAVPNGGEDPATTGVDLRI